MQISSDVKAIANSLLRPHNLKVDSYTTLQALWAGYGQICRLNVSQIDSSTDTDNGTSTLILKLVSPPATASKANEDEDEGHLRKIISYQVEQYFYTHLAPKLPKGSAAVAECLASNNPDSNGSDSGKNERTGTIAMILTDLRARFPISGERRGKLDELQAHAALDWLGTFHGFWWREKSTFDTAKRELLRRPPLEEARRLRRGSETGVWLNGGYTYLATRRKEYAGLANDGSSEWAGALCQPEGHGQLSLAERVAQLLAPSASGESSRIGEYETLIHGDVKSENLFSTSKGDAVAFFDFQYVGLGIGQCDLAKLFTCSIPESLLADTRIKSGETLKMQAGEEKLLKQYLTTLQETSGKSYDWDTFVNHWQAALVDWLRFQASWGFWGNVEWLEARVRCIIQDKGWREWLNKE